MERDSNTRSIASMPQVTAIIPALDEEEAIGLVVAELAPLVAEVVVVDNGSRDRTADGGPRRRRARGRRAAARVRAGLPGRHRRRSATRT